jgi:hypothetical protein
MLIYGAGAFGEELKPLIFIPGILGSKLCTNDSSKEVVWGNINSLRNIQRLKLPLNDPSTDTRFVPCGIIENVSVVGPFKVHQYDHLIDILHDLGYEKDKTLFLFNYDWRQSNHLTAERLHQRLKTHLPSGQFDIIGHSMGGIVARLYFEQYGDTARVDRFITMGTPHRGAVDILKMADSGWSWWKNALAGGMPSIREALLSFPSTFQLLPSYQDCCFKSPPGTPSNARVPFDPFSVDLWQNIGWLPDEYRHPAGIASLRKKLDEARSVHALLKKDISRDVEFIPLVTGLVQTVWRTYLNPDNGKFIRWDKGNGDGTVYERSAANMRMIDARPSTTEHARIFHNDSARQVLRWALVGDVKPTSGRFLEEYRATVRAGAGIQLVSIGLSLDPSVVNAGASTAFRVRLVGEKALATTDFPVTIMLSSQTGEQSLPFIVSSVKGDDYSTERLFEASFKAPSQEGVYRLSVFIPGLDPLEEMLLVTP